VLDQADALIGQQMIRASLQSKDLAPNISSAYRLLLRREEQRLYAERPAKMDNEKKKDAPFPHRS
jgi:hypothetical protein